jgi:L-asparaginase
LRVDEQEIRQVVVIMIGWLGYLSGIGLVAALLLSFVPPPLGAETKPNIRILATGGTIAGSAAASTDAAYKSGQLSVDVLIEAVPEIQQLAVVEGEQISQVASQNMNDSIWLGLVRRVNQLLGSDGVDGIVITHGTDTMEETAYFLNLVVRSAKPVVLTGALRPATALGSDGALNLYNAVAVAADPDAAGRGVLIAINDDIHGARDATKTNVSDVQTFVSPNRGVVGYSSYGNNRFLRQPKRKHTVDSEFSIDRLDELPRVDIVYAHANMRGDHIDAAVSAGARGIVIAGTGNGNMSQPGMDAASRAVQKGVVVVRSTRTGSGIVGRNIEIDDDKLGFVVADDLNPQKARVLLKLALTKTSDIDTIQQMFLDY